MRFNQTLFAVALALLALGPVLGLYIADAFGADLIGLGFWGVVWVGPVLSLPVTLLIARAFGPSAYRSYWAHLESYPGNTKKGITVTWGSVTVITLIIGVITFYMDWRDSRLMAAMGGKLPLGRDGYRACPPWAQ